MKATKDLKRFVERLDTLKDQLLDELQDMVDNREQTFDNRTEKWQESENGELHMEVTERIQEMRDDLDSQFDNIFTELDEFDNL
jgi:ElaB/YqjD/DUF883 family membrane-anchored ribosome-binding protein